MSKFKHYLLLGTIVVICAALSAFTVRRILTNSDTQTNIGVESAIGSAPSTKLTPTIAIYLPKNADGVYILPTANPTNPLELGANTVGGATACERLNNLKICLEKKQSSLAGRLRSPEATPSAGLNTVCGDILNELADIRPETVEIGCIW
ncbi:hypothetical protein KBB12_03625 [Candidatus Woesebacteria bacterium]|nr:hypothetical protein [Candidatus Woesebacteria bacterium]